MNGEPSLSLRVVLTMKQSDTQCHAELVSASLKILDLSPFFLTPFEIFTYFTFIDCIIKIIVEGLSNFISASFSSPI